MDWQKDCSALHDSFFFDRNTDAVKILLRSPTGGEQTGEVNHHKELRGFAGMRICFLDSLVQKGWTWKLVQTQEAAQ